MRLTELPDHGKVVVAHTSCERIARQTAEREGLPYLLSANCPPNAAFAYVLDVDATFAPQSQLDLSARGSVPVAAVNVSGKKP